MTESKPPAKTHAENQMTVKLNWKTIFWSVGRIATVGEWQSQADHPTEWQSETSQQ